MKMTINIHGVGEDFADDLARDIENACAYYISSPGQIRPTCDINLLEESDPDYKVEKCVMCHCEHFAMELTEDGMCDDCAYELAEQEFQPTPTTNMV